MKRNVTRRGCGDVRISWECYVAGLGISGYNNIIIYIYYTYAQKRVSGGAAAAGVPVAREGYCAKNI